MKLDLRPEVWVVAESLEEAKVTLRDRKQVAAIVSTTWTDWIDMLSKKINCITKKYKCKPTLISATYNYQQERKMVVYGPYVREAYMSSADPLLEKMATNVRLAKIGRDIPNSLEYYREVADATVLIDNCCVEGVSCYGGSYPCVDLLKKAATNTGYNITTVKDEGKEYYYATGKLFDIPEEANIAPIPMQSVDRIDSIERPDDNTIKIGVVDIFWKMPSKTIPPHSFALQVGFVKNNDSTYTKDYTKAMLARIQF